jgi:hypothetical protein
MCLLYGCVPHRNHTSFGCVICRIEVKDKSVKNMQLLEDRLLA